MGFTGRTALDAYNFGIRLFDWGFSHCIAGAFLKFGEKSIIQRPVRISGASKISIGKGVFIGAGGWLNALADDQKADPVIEIGDGTSMSGICVISAVNRVQLEAKVLLARNVYISDHIHRYDQIGVPIMAQGVEKIRPVLIRKGAWLGQNVVVCPGVTIGRGSVIGANSVVNTDIPDYSIAVGAPARVVRTFYKADTDK